MEQFANMPRWAQYLVTVIVGLVIVGVGYYAFLSGQQTQLQDKIRQSEDLDTKIRQGKEAQKRLDELNRQIDQILQQLEIVKSIIPVEPETGKLLRVFQGFARDENLRIRTISPGSITKQDLYSQQPYKVSVQGGYNDLAMFFDKIAHMRRIVNIGHLEIKGAPPRSGATVEANFQAIVYMQNPEAFQALEKKS
ncbi:MAG: type 4a pilus biogenesis protein PilO [Acidobacteriota bacterium]|jgi:type IV pilus assembly protein PilO